MNEQKLRRIFESARRELPPAPPPNFGGRVLGALRREDNPLTRSLWDQLALLVPRMTCAAAVVVVLCVAADYGLTALNVPSLTDGATQLSEQWLFAVN